LNLRACVSDTVGDVAAMRAEKKVPDVINDVLPETRATFGYVVRINPESQAWGHVMSVKHHRSSGLVLNVLAPRDQHECKAVSIALPGDFLTTVSTDHHNCDNGCLTGPSSS